MTQRMLSGLRNHPLQKSQAMLERFIAANPYGKKLTLGSYFKKTTQFAIGSLELAAVVHVPAYRALIRRRIKRPVALMVIGAQKAGTTWVHAQFAEHDLMAVSAIKECHHFDRGRLYTLKSYLAQFQSLSSMRPIAEVAPDYGPMPIWRIRAIKAIFPQLEIVFLARNPVERAWSGTKMETTLGRGITISKVPVKELVNHLCLNRSFRYGDYSSQIRNWRHVFGHERVRVFPFDQISTEPNRLLRSIMGPVQGLEADALPSGRSFPVFKGENINTPVAATTVLKNAYYPLINAFADTLGSDVATETWAATLENWRQSMTLFQSAPESDRVCLVVCGFAPNPMSTSAGQKLAYRRIVECSQRFKEVRVIFFTNELDALDTNNTELWPENVKYISQIDITRADRIWALVRYPRQPCFVSVRRLLGSRQIAEQLDDPAITDYFADFSQGLAPIPPDALRQFVFRQHDILSKLYSRHAANSSSWLTRVLYQIETWRTRRWEHRVWQSVLRIETLTKDDTCVIEAVSSQIDVAASHVRGSLHIDASERSVDTIVPGRIGFWGNMARIENVDAVSYFCEQMLDDIRTVHPDAHVWIVGAHPTDEVLSLRNQNVHVTGFVDDPAEIFSTLSVAVAPLRLGSGVKIKVYETIDSGIPTVASTVGAEGIEPHPLLHVAFDEKGFIESVTHLLN